MSPRRSGAAGQVERTASGLMATSSLREEALFGIVGRIGAGRRFINILVRQLALTLLFLFLLFSFFLFFFSYLEQFAEII